jgi:hypothetical protein
MATTRALAYVSDLLARLDAEGNTAGQIVKLNGSYDPNPDSPNYAFWKATPSLSHEMTINNPAAFGVFKLGQKIWIDFTPVEE